MTEIVIAPPKSLDVDLVAPAYLDWAAILGGTILATAISVIMAAFGSGIGLSLTSPVRGGGMPGKGVAVATALWVVWVSVSSFLAGGYFAGRTRRGVPDATDHERAIRDGAHGLIVWALAALLTVYFASSAISNVASLAAEATATSVGGALSNVEKADPLGYAADSLLTSDGTAPSVGDGQRQEIARILSTSVINGSMNADDKAYLTKVVAARSGVAPANAEKRVDAVDAQLTAAVEKAKQAAEAARKIGILIAFLTAASLAIGAAGAWWGASFGGRHRDENMDLSHLTRW